MKEVGDLPRVDIANDDLTDPGIRYSALLQQDIDGQRDAAFLKKLSVMAEQVGDKNDADRIGRDYIATLRPPFSDDDLQSVAQFTTSTKEAGYALLRDHAEQLFVSADDLYTLLREQSAVGKEKETPIVRIILFMDEV
jgi:hypothetical protein